MADTFEANAFLIAASALNGVIGNNGAIPWHAPHDLKRFKSLTQGCALIMGRATWESLPGPLPGRPCIVVTSRPLDDAGCIAASSVDEAVRIAREMPRDRAATVAFAGGTRIYEAALSLPWLTRAYITKVHVEPEGDTYMPKLGLEWIEIGSQTISPEGGIRCDFILYKRKEPHG